MKKDGDSRRWLITGGSGFLGINLVRMLLDNGQIVRTLDIEEFGYDDCSDRVDHIIGDIRNLDSVNRAMEGIDIVVHTAAALPLYPKKEIFDTDILGTKNVVKSAKENGVERFIHISSTAVYGIPDHHPLVEDDTLEGVGAYGIAKIEAERICEEARDSDFFVTIIRPKSFIGPERLGVFALFYDWAKDGKNFPLIGNGKNRYQLLDVEDLCDCIVLSSKAPEDVANDVYNIGAGEFSTMKEDYQAVLDRAGFGKKIRCFPATPMIWTLRFLEFFKLSPLYKWVYETASKDSFVSIERARDRLGYEPKFSNKDALIRNYEWYLEHLDSFEGSSGVSHRAPWKQGILRIAKLFF